MHKSMFVFIWTFSSRQQILALVLTLISFPFLYFSFDLPKTIINNAIKEPPGLNESGSVAGDATTAVPVPEEIVDVEVFGFNFTEILGIEMERLPYLFLLCALFLALVCINGAFKMRINTFKGILAERLLRRMRFMLIERTMRFPLPQFQKTSSGEVVTMVTAEVEPLGGFFGDAYVLPAFQGGTFLTIIGFLFVQDPMMGFAATALVPVQGYIIPKLQKKINQLGKQRVKHVRSLSNRVGEVVTGVQDVRAHGGTGFVMADISSRLSRIFWVRLEIYQRKFFMKFVNNFINQMTPFLFYAIGGYLVLFGELTIGALVAALAAYKDLAAPWKELLNWYQRLADSKIKYEQLISQFQPTGMLPEELQKDQPDELPRLDGPIKASGLTWTDDDGVRIIDGATFTIQPKESIAILSSSGTARDVMGRLLGRVLMPTSGSFELGGAKVDTLHESVSGARIGYVTSEPAFYGGTIADNLMVGLNRIPPLSEMESAKADEDRLRDIEEAIASGNSPFSPDHDWIDYMSAGAESREEVLDRATALMKIVEMEDDMYTIGLRMTFDAESNPGLTEKILVARDRVQEILGSRGLDDLVQTYDFEKYNTYASVAGNILFGKPLDESWEYENWPNNPIIQQMMEKHGLVDDFFDIGMRCAQLMVDLFKDLPPGHPFFDQYSFVDEDSLPELKLIARKAEQQNGASELTDSERRLIIGLPFNLTVQRHRLGLLDDEMLRRLVALRHDLRESHPEVFSDDGPVTPYHENHVNKGLSILDNILFGRVVHGRPDAQERVGTVVREVAVDMGIEAAIMRAGLDFNVGIGGGRLAAGQRQKLNIVRALLKQPDILVMVEALSSVEGVQRERISSAVFEASADRTQIWIGSTPPEGVTPGRSLEIKNGRISEAGEITVEAERPADEDNKAEEALGSEARSLQELPLFSNLDATKLKFLAFTSERLTYRPGEILMRQGDDGEDAYVILDGAAEVVIESEGEEQVLFELGANRLVGELALLCDSKRTATVRAKKPTTALRLNREVFSEMARQDPHFSFEMTRDLGRRLILTTSELNRSRNELARATESQS